MTNLRSSCRAPLVLLALVFSLLAAGCAGGDDALNDLEAAADEVAEAAGEVAEETEQLDEVAAPATDVDCERLFRHHQSYVQVAGTLGVAEEPSGPLEVHGESGLTLAEEAIVAFRPHQDVEPAVFSPLREGLDNLENDIQAVRDGTFAGATGTYSSAAFGPVLEAIGC